MVKRKAPPKSQIVAGSRVGRNKTLIDALATRGLTNIESLHVLKYVAVWGLYLEETGNEPRTVDEICELVSYKRAVMFKWQTAFRKAFPEYTTPAILWSVARGWATADDT